MTWARNGLLGLPLVLAGCPASTTTDTDTADDTGTPAAEFEQITVDATDDATFVLLDLDAGAMVVGDKSADTDWDLALRRFEIQVNGGTSGPGTAASGIALDRADLYAADGEPLVDGFLEATAEDALPDLLSVTEIPPLAPDAIAGVLGEDWFSYDPGTGVASADDTVGWLVRGGEGTSYARVRVTELDFPTRDGNGIVRFTVSVELESGGVLGKALQFQGSVPGQGGAVCFDMDTNTNVDCTGTAWDLSLGFQGRDTFLRTNSGDVGTGDGGALGPIPWTELQTYTAATQDPKGSDLTPWYAEDVSESAFSTEPWYAYDLQGRHQFYPNYRVYVVRTSDDGPAYAVQVLSYYDDSSVSGHVTLRWVAL